MSLSQLNYGLERLTAKAADFRIGQMDPRRMAVPLLVDQRIYAWVSEEILEDLQGTPSLERILDEGIERARDEVDSDSPRLVFIGTTGVTYGE